MAEYIEREAAYRFAQDQLKKETGAYSRGWNHAMNVMKSALHNNDALPAADVVPVRHGRWMRIDYKPIGHDYQCSECKSLNDRASKYCPDCGARMDLKGGDREGDNP